MLLTMGVEVTKFAGGDKLDMEAPSHVVLAGASGGGSLGIDCHHRCLFAVSCFQHACFAFSCFQT